MIAGTMVVQEGDCRLVGSVDSVVPAGRGQRGASRLVGREAERAVLSGWLDEAAGGAGRVGVVLGEAGIGKSRLLDALAAEASDRAMEVLRRRAATSPRSTSSSARSCPSGAVPTPVRSSTRC